MDGVKESFIKKGYIPLAATELAGIGWQGESLVDFWMWNRKFSEYEGGIKHIRTVKVRELKEAALHYWLDKWVPVRPVSGELLRKMEGALRAHPAFKNSNIRVPDGEFLEPAEDIPLEYIGPEVRSLLGLPDAVGHDGLVSIETVPSEVISSFKMQLIGGSDGRVV